MYLYGIPPEQWNKIISCISSNCKVTGITLFGSRAKGNYKNGSDIDFALSGKELTTSDVISLSTALDSIDIPWEIDMILLDRITDQALTEHIKRCGLKVF